MEAVPADDGRAANHFVLIQPVYQVAVRKTVAGLQPDRRRLDGRAGRREAGGIAAGWSATASSRLVSGRRHGAAGDAGDLPDRQHRAGRPGAARTRRHAASDPAQVAEFREEVGARPADLGPLLAVPARPGAGRSRHVAVLAPAGADGHREYAPATIELASVAFVLSLLVGLPLGIVAAVRRDSWIDNVARVVSLIGVSAPTFWLAFIMLAIFYGWLDLGARAGPTRPCLLPAGPRHRAAAGGHGAGRRLGDLPRRRGASGAALHRAGERDAGPDHPHHPRRHAGGAVAGLCARRPRQGAAPARRGRSAMRRRTPCCRWSRWAAWPTPTCCRAR